MPNSFVVKSSLTVRTADSAPPPEHLDYWSRNDRLYKTLLDMGLYVEPIFSDDSRRDINYLRVSVGKPSHEQDHG